MHYIPYAWSLGQTFRLHLSPLIFGIFKPVFKLVSLQSWNWWPDFDCLIHWCQPRM